MPVSKTKVKRQQRNECSLPALCPVSTRIFRYSRVQKIFFWSGFSDQPERPRNKIRMLRSVVETDKRHEEDSDCSIDSSYKPLRKDPGQAQVFEHVHDILKNKGFRAPSRYHYKMRFLRSEPERQACKMLFHLLCLIHFFEHLLKLIKSDAITSSGYFFKF